MIRKRPPKVFEGKSFGKSINIILKQSLRLVNTSLHRKKLTKNWVLNTPDQANDFFHVTKLELNISDQISGFVSGNSFSYHVFMENLWMGE
ncbi:MAG: hypothetical protein CM15mP65_27910 [Crocinitomicaceae bacterium]|nr:MAG: hypothetical protein CM15mP65_27910 [Crocinitomicaceae bacterium]